MNVRFKCPERLLREVRNDLARPHLFAYERVGFVLAGAAWSGVDLMLLARSYLPLADGDYNRNPNVGAEIGRSAMRKALEAAYRNTSALIHIHTHGGSGVPEFSTPDLNSAPKFVPGFFNTVSRLPHGVMVLSNDSATGLLWVDRDLQPVEINQFETIGAAVRKFGASHETA